MKRFTFIMMCTCLLAAAACRSKGEKAQEKPESVEVKDTVKIEMKTENMEMEMKKIDEPEFDIITNYGTMRVKLYGDTPKHRDNFVRLVSEKFYDGIRFHRIIEGFMIQTGDPYSRDLNKINQWGTGGPTPEYTVPAEFVAGHTHKKGALAAARKGDLANPRKASSGSQFYIVHDPDNCRHLDGQYSIFGEVTSGLEVVDKIATTPTDMYNRPENEVIIKTIKPVIDIAPKAVEPGPDTTKAE